MVMPAQEQYSDVYDGWQKYDNKYIQLQETWRTFKKIVLI